jgi:hypothetical protein
VVGAVVEDDVDVETGRDLAVEVCRNCLNSIARCRARNLPMTLPARAWHRADARDGRRDDHRRGETRVGAKLGGRVSRIVRRCGDETGSFEPFQDSGSRSTKSQEAGDMSEPLRISIQELRQVLGALLDEIAAVSGEVVEIPDTPFWAIPADIRHNVYEEPRDLTIGQLSEAWNNARATTSSDEVPLRYGFVWLPDVLREIGEQPLI